MAQGLEEGQVPCVRCGQNAWPVQIAVGQQVFTIWLCAEHIEQYQNDFAALAANADWLAAAAQLHALLDAGWRVEISKHESQRTQQPVIFVAAASGGSGWDDEIVGEGENLAAAIDDLAEEMRALETEDEGDG